MKLLMLVSAAVILVAFVYFVHIPILENNFSSSNVPAPIPKSVTKSAAENIPSNITYVSIVAGAGGSAHNTSGYIPPTVRITAGHAVRWINNDSALHTVTSGVPNKGLIGKLFDSKLLNGGKTFTFTFTSNGTFDYYCILHPYMRGQVIVT